MDETSLLLVVLQSFHPLYKLLPCTQVPASSNRDHSTKKEPVPSSRAGENHGIIGPITFCFSAV